MTEEDFLGMVQEGIDDWAKTVIATGGNIKISKSHAKVNVPKWMRGYCKAHKISRLPTTNFTVPQRDGSVKTMKTLVYSVAKKSLGIQFTGDGKTTKAHTDWMKEKATKWTTSLRSKGFLKPQDGWKSLNTQLKPKLEYGLVALCAKPKTLDKLMSRIQHEALSPLGFNQKIYKELRTINEI